MARSPRFHCAVLVLFFALGLLSTPAQAEIQTFHMGINVTSPTHPIKVIVRWRVNCSLGDVSRQTKGEFRATTPVTRAIYQSVMGATQCHLTAVAWQTHRPHWQDGVRPIVQTWVRH